MKFWPTPFWKRFKKSNTLENTLYNQILDNLNKRNHPIMIMDHVGWRKISKECPECGVDDYEVRDLGKGMETRQKHKKDCKQLPVIYPKDD